METYAATDAVDIGFEYISLSDDETPVETVVISSTAEMGPFITMSGAMGDIKSKKM